MMTFCDTTIPGRKSLFYELFRQKNLDIGNFCAILKMKYMNKCSYIIRKSYDAFL